MSMDPALHTYAHPGLTSLGIPAGGKECRLPSIAEALSKTMEESAGQERERWREALKQLLAGLCMEVQEALRKMQKMSRAPR